MGSIRRICQYCGVQFGTTPNPNGPDGDSHGICPECVKLPEDQQMALYRARQKPKSFSEFMK
jgi:hypothetical protein